jgi:integrase/recombinase XerD
MNELLTEFLESEKLKGARKQYLIGLRHRVPKLLHYLSSRGLEFGELKVRGALAFQGELIETRAKNGGKYASATVLAYVFAALAFYDFLKEKGLVSSNPFKEIRKVRAEKKLPRNLLKEKEMDRFLERLAHFEEGQTLKHRVFRYRVHVIAELMYSTGLRISEVADLRVEDVDLRRSLIEVREGKGGRARVAFLNEYAREVLRVYLEKMRPLVFSQCNERNGGLLFGTGWGWLGHVVNATLKEAAKEAETIAPTSHGFRHALGYHLLRSGCGIRYIQQILGHRKLSTTEIYTKVEKEDLKAVMDRHHPRRLRRLVDEAVGL